MAIATIAQRQPSTPPAAAATPPTKNGPTTRPSGRPTPSQANMRVRTLIGYWSAISEGAIGRRAPANNPEAVRTMPITNTCEITPVSMMNPDHSTVAPARILVRL